MTAIGSSVFGSEHTSTDRSAVSVSRMLDDVFGCDDSQEQAFSSEYGAITARMDETFGDVISRLVDREGISLAELGRRVGLSRGHMANIVKGTRSVSPEDADAILTQLAVRGRERDRLMDLATLTHIPDAMQPYFRRLLKRLEAWEADRPDP